MGSVFVNPSVNPVTWPVTRDYAKVKWHLLASIDIKTYDPAYETSHFLLCDGDIKKKLRPMWGLRLKCPYFALLEQME